MRITKNLCEDQKEWIETTNHLKEEAERLRAEVERLNKQSGIMTDDMLDQFDKP